MYWAQIDICESQLRVTADIKKHPVFQWGADSLTSSIKTHPVHRH